MIKKYGDIINEGGFSRMMLSLRGLVPSIRTIGIVTGYNPCGKKKPISVNREANKNMEKELVNGNFGFRKVIGDYGDKEESFMIPNITKDELLDIGKRYIQESVIFGSEIENGFKFELIVTRCPECPECPGKDFGKVDSVRYVYNIGNFDSFYTEYKNRKFNIPFFDDEYKDAKWKPNSGAIDKNLVKEDVIFNINKKLDKIFNEENSGKSKWLARGEIKNILFENYKD